ncbi:thioredoxin family protein [Serratia marcescens]|uniref:thioredoxin family protein n=1 Tax=Serratia marcescens TaxID=615 RepID=UPI003A8B44AC
MIDITAENFFQALQNATNPVLVDFWAPWCVPCLALEPFLDQITARYGHQLTILRCDVEQNVDLIANYGLRGVPTLIGFANGQEVVRCTGGNVAQLHAIVNRLLQSPALSTATGAFNNDNVLRLQVISDIQRTPEEAIPLRVTEWLQHPKIVAGIPALVLQLILFQAEQYPPGERKTVFEQLLSTIAVGADLSGAGRTLAQRLLAADNSRMNSLFDITPEINACWRTLQYLQQAHLQGETRPSTEWQTVSNLLARFSKAEDPVIASAASNLAMFASPVNSDDLSLFLELYRLTSDEQADMLYHNWQDQDMQACQQAIDDYLLATLTAHTRQLNDILTTAPRRGC